LAVGSSGVRAYLAQVDRLLAAGQGLFPPASQPGRGAPITGGGEIPAPPPGASGLSVGSSGAAQDYRSTLTQTAALDDDVIAATRAADTIGQNGRTGAMGVRQTAQSAAAAIAPATNSPAGVKLLVSSMDERLADMQRQIDTTKAQNALLAGRLRQMVMAYRSAGPGGALGAARGAMGGGMGGMPSMGGFGGGIPGMSALSGLPASLASLRRSETSTVGEGIPGGAGTGVGGLTLNSSPKQVAAAIIGEARRRGYSKRQAIAILSTAMQESGLRPRAVSSNGLWKSIFQQDSGYRNRDNPNAVIAQFFDRLERHGGPGSRDIWKSIFWLQQRPGEASAEAAYANGRRAYLSEIQSQQAHAERLYEEIVSTA
jgi:hypothetical protein